MRGASTSTVYVTALQRQCPERGILILARFSALGTFGEGRKSYLTVGLPWEMLSFAAGHNYFRRPHFYAGGSRYPVPLRHIKIGFGELFPFPQILVNSKSCQLH